jgi:excisionase family DNA binding protein
MAEMLTAKDMQALLQVDRSTIYRMAEANRIPAVKVGKQWRFPREQVDLWLQAQAAGPGLPPPAVALVNSDLSSLLPLECVQLIQDTFADTLGVMLVITDMQGKPITQVSHACGLFETIHQMPDAVQKCIESWHDLGTAIEVEPKFMPSALGLLCARGVIKVGTELKGMVVMGCIAPNTWPPGPEDITHIAEAFGISPNVLMPHINEVFHLDKAHQQRALSFIQRIANIVAHIINERNTLMGKLESIARLAA